LCPKFFKNSQPYDFLTCFIPLNGFCTSQPCTAVQLAMTANRPQRCRTKGIQCTARPSRISAKAKIVASFAPTSVPSNSPLHHAHQSRPSQGGSEDAIMVAVTPQS